MQITLYLRTYPVEGAPVAVSLDTFPRHQRQTFTSGGKVYQAVFRELHLDVPDGAVLDAGRKTICWPGRGRVIPTQAEVVGCDSEYVSAFVSGS
jgi:hypothetical protein